MKNVDDVRRPWYDYEPSSQQRIPDHVEFLRIGFIQYHRLLQGNTKGSIFDIEHQAFISHPNLQHVQIYLPAVAKIVNMAFYSCQKLEEVEFVLKPKTGKNGDAKEEQDQANPLKSRLVSIGRSSFYRCKNLRRVHGLEHAGESLEEIGHSAFRNCLALSEVNFLSSLVQLKSLGAWAFKNCISLTGVDLSKAVTLTELSEGTFCRCFALTSLHLPPNLLVIGHQAFYECSALGQILLPTSLQRIDRYAFGSCKELTSIVLPTSLQKIRSNCFGYCDNLSCVVLQSSRVPFLKLRPFSESCSSLSRLELPTPVPRQQWPLILEQFSQDFGIASSRGQIPNPKNRKTIIWNFLRQNLAQLFMEENAAA